MEMCKLFCFVFLDDICQITIFEFDFLGFFFAFYITFVSCGLLSVSTLLLSF